METTVAGIKRRASYCCEGPEAKRLGPFLFFWCQNKREQTCRPVFLNLIMLCPGSEGVAISLCAVVSNRFIRSGLHNEMMHTFMGRATSKKRGIDPPALGFLLTSPPCILWYLKLIDYPSPLVAACHILQTAAPTNLCSMLPWQLITVMWKLHASS